MFRLRLANTCVRRFLSACPAKRAAVLDQLQACSSEEQVFEVVGESQAMLEVNHVGCAVGMLWRFQKAKPDFLRSVGAVKSHPQFLTLRVLAESNVSLMDDCVLVDMLYDCRRLEVEPHDSLIQQLVLEASARLDGLPLRSLSKFAMCLNDQQLKHSPLMGRITDIVARKLSTIDDTIILTTLMVSVSALVSPGLTDALLDRVGCLLDSEEPPAATPLSIRRAVQFMRDVDLGRHHHSHRALLEKCDRLLLPGIPLTNAEHVCILLHHYRALHFTSWQFRLAAKQRLTELMELTTDPWHFAHLFEALYPMASPEVGERLENTALLLADEFIPLAALKVTESLEGRRSRNHTLINKMASIIQKNLHAYRPVELAMITKALLVLHCKTPDLISELRACLISSLQRSFSPRHVAMLVRVLATLPRPRLEPASVGRLDAVLPQCDLRDLSSLARAVARVMVRPHRHHHHQGGPTTTTGPGWAYDDPPMRLLQELSRCGRRRLGEARSAHTLLGELQHAGGEWFEETLLEPAVAMLQAMSGQIRLADVAPLAHLLVDNNHLCAPLLDRIASLTLEDIDKIHPCSTYDSLLPFSLLNYDPPISDQLFDVCVQHFKPHIGSFNPHELVLMAYALVVAGRFPEEVFREIFNIDFLAKLDAFLQTMPDALSMQVRRQLMGVNRALCLEYPQLQVPWFHTHYCQQLQRKTAALPGNASSPVRRQIYKVLSEVLGGADYTRALVITPYFYTIDFECMLDRHQRPVAYSKLNHLQITDTAAAQWSAETAETTTNELPPGAQRVAVDFLEARSFCNNSRHMMGEAMMRKRHLEIMGYRVVQIPHFEWNSMELSTEDSLKGYLKKKLFTESSSSSS